MKEQDYLLGDVLVKYLINEKGQVGMVMAPQSKPMAGAWRTPNDPFDATALYTKEWNMGSIVHLHLRHHWRSISGGNTMKYAGSVEGLRFASQTVNQLGDGTQVVTMLTSDEGYSVLHTLTHVGKYGAFYCDTVFINDSDKEFTLEMLSSFSLDNLSPLCEGDMTDVLNVHRYRGGWSLEGKHICEPLEQLAMEKPWFGAFIESERYGVIGSWPVGRYFPTTLIEDKQNGVYWGAQIRHNASWQMEITRHGDTISLSGGLADMEFGGWYKIVAPGQQFAAPRAYLACCAGDDMDVCQRITGLHNIACDDYDEQGMPISFNDWCSSYGSPTHEKTLAYADKLKGRKVKYLIIDAGWTKTLENSFGQGGNGEWLVDTTKFPDMKNTTDEIRKRGFVPGIWFEFEVATKGARVFEKEYDHMKVTRDGHVVVVSGDHKFWDFTRKDVQEYLYEKVIKFIKDNGFGYLKVDYNRSIGLGCDGVESLGEGLRIQMRAVYEFFKKIKAEIPDLIIENCSSGGHRNDPMMMGITAITSTSDAHESIEIPHIAANMHALLLPRQNLVWAVLHASDSDQRLAYTLSATFLGRMCLSGEIDGLSDHQWEVFATAENFYDNISHIIKYGHSKITADRSLNISHPRGSQIVTRTLGNEMLVVCHTFDEPTNIRLHIGAGYTIKEAFFPRGLSLEGDTLVLQDAKALCGMALHLIKE